MPDDTRQRTEGDVVKLFISTNSAVGMFKRRDYVLADKINTFNLRRAGTEPQWFQIEGALDSATTSYHITLGYVSEEHAHRLRRDLFELIAQAAASPEPRAKLIECVDGAWREH